MTRVNIVLTDGTSFTLSLREIDIYLRERDWSLEGYGGSGIVVDANGDKVGEYEEVLC